MKSRNILTALAAAFSAAAMLTSCDIECLPNSSLAADEVQNNPEQSLDGLLDGAYAQLAYWSDPMHRLGEYAGDNMMIRGSSTDAFYQFISFSRLTTTVCRISGTMATRLWHRPRTSSR